MVRARRDNVAVEERRQPREILRPHGVPRRSELVDDGPDPNGVPYQHRVFTMDLLRAVRDVLVQHRYPKPTRDDFVQLEQVLAGFLYSPKADYDDALMEAP